MKKLLPFLLLLFFGVGNASSQTFNWSRQLSNISGNNFGNAVSVDSARNSYVTGAFIGTITFPNPNNCPTFTTTGVNNNDADIFVAKFDSNGVCQWAKQYGGGSYDEGFGISVDSQGNSYVTGYFTASATFGNGTLTSSQGSADVFIAKLNQNGALQWAVRGGGSGPDMGYGVASRGRPYVTGWVSNPNNGPVTFSSTFGPPCTLTGVTNSQDLFIVGYSSAGVCQVSKRAGGISPDWGSGISLDGIGNVYVTGVLSGQAFIAKGNPMLTQLWVKTVNGNTIPYSISTDSQGNSYIAGHFSGTATFPMPLTSAGSDDAFIAKYGTTGAVVWAKRMGGPGLDIARSISVRETCDLFVTGYFWRTANFGGTTSLTSTGSRDIFVARYDINGGIQWVIAAGGSGADEGRGISADSFGKASVIGVYQSNPAMFVGTSPNLANPNVTLQNIFFAKASP